MLIKFWYSPRRINSKEPQSWRARLPCQLWNSTQLCWAYLARSYQVIRKGASTFAGHIPRIRISLLKTLLMRSCRLIWPWLSNFCRDHKSYKNHLKTFPYVTCSHQKLTASFLWRGRPSSQNSVRFPKPKTTLWKTIVTILSVYISRWTGQEKAFSTEMT